MRRRLVIALSVTAALVVAFVVGFVRPDLDRAELRARYATETSVFAPVMGMDVHVSDVGTGPVVVLIHGLFDSLRTWDAVAAALTSTHRVIRFDLPGHGLTGPDPTDDYVLARQVAFVDALTRQLGVQKFSVVGNSLGGEIAWNYAGTYPDKVERLVLVDAAGQPRKKLPGIVAFARLPVLGKLLEWCTPRFIVARIAAGAWAPGSVVPESYVDRFAELERHPGNRPAIRHRLEQRSDTPDLTPLTHITAPTLVLWGEQDPWIPVENADAFGRGIKGAEVVKYPGVGHVPQEEAPAKVIADLRRFLPVPPPATPAP